MLSFIFFENSDLVKSQKKLYAATFIRNGYPQLVLPAHVLGEHDCRRIGGNSRMFCFIDFIYILNDIEGEPSYGLYL